MSLSTIFDVSFRKHSRRSAGYYTLTAAEDEEKAPSPQNLHRQKDSQQKSAAAEK